MGRIGKEANRYRTKEDKRIKEALNGGSSVQAAKRYDISDGMLKGWSIQSKIQYF